MRSFEGIEVLTDSSLYRNHALDELGFGEKGIVGSGRSFAGGVEKFLRVPSAFSIDDLQEKSFTFSTWLKFDETLPTKAEDSVFGTGYLVNPDSSYFNDINNILNLSRSGSRILQSGPRQGLYFDVSVSVFNGGFSVVCRRQAAFLGCLILMAF